MSNASTQSVNSQTYEARPPRVILERLAAVFSAKGMDPSAPIGKSHNATMPCDFAAAASMAAEKHPIGWLAFWARWMGSGRDQSLLASHIAPLGQGRAPGDKIPKLAAVAAMDYCHGPFGTRKICRILRISRTHTWPKLEGAYRRMLSEAFNGEANFGAELRKFIR